MGEFAYSLGLAVNFYLNLLFPTEMEEEAFVYAESGGPTASVDELKPILLQGIAYSVSYTHLTLPTNREV